MVQLMLILAVLFAAPAGATTYYVATNGSNSNDGLTEATPKLTVAHCVSLMVAGDTCLVKNGTYNEGLIRFGRTGTQANPIRLAAFPGHAPKIVFVDPEGVNFDRILIQNFSGQNVAIGWITIEGLELTNGHDGVKFHSLHDSAFLNNHIHDIRYMGILGIGGARNRFERNIIHHNGRFAACDAGTTTLCIQDHGIYAHGQDYTITNNIFYYHQGFGIQHNCSSSSSFNASVHPSPDFAGAQNWIVSDNTFAYSRTRGGYVVWGSACDGTRIENNIFYENNIERPSNPQGIEFLGAGNSNGMFIRNNHFYASGSGATVAIGTGAPADLVTSGNVINVSPPAFVNGGNNSLPAAPDFRLTASSPVNMARANEFPNNTTNVVGAFKTLANPTPSITANKITGIYPLNTAGPIQNLSATGVTVGCTGSACPGSPTVSSVSKVSGTDSQFEAVISGITGNACEAANQTWTLSYDSGAGSWTGNDNIGPAPGSHQKIFSFTNLSVTNLCTGGGPPAPPAGAYLEYLFSAGSGTTAANTGSLGAPGDGTLNNGVTWVGGGGISITGGGTQNLSIPYGAGVNPSTQSLTIGFLVDIPAGQESLGRTVFGSSLGTNQRFYVSMLDGTWRLGMQASNDGTAGDLTVDVGPQHICVVANAATDVVTLYKNGQASMSAGGAKAISSYVLSGNFELGRLPAFTNGPTAVYKNFELYRSVEDCNALYLSSQAPPVNPAGTFSQTSIQYQDVFLPSVGGGPTVLSAPNNTKKVIQNGAVAAVFQVECNDCAQTAFRIAARDNGMGEWLQVPNTVTSANLYMWGAGGQQFLNGGTLTTRILENGCTVVDGATLLTASQIPQITLPASGCVVLRYLVRVSPTANGYTELRLEKEGGVAFTGTYVLGRIDIIAPQAGGIGF